MDHPLRSALLCAALFPVAVWSQTTAAEQARAAFDKVDSSAVPALQDTMLCMQAHAALLPAVSPDQQYLVHYRRGYCALLGAVVSKDAAEFREASREFSLAIEKRAANAAPAHSGLLAGLGIAQARGSPGSIPPEALRNLEAAAQRSNCSDSALMQPEFCRDLIDVARLWLGWAALEAGRLSDAARWFSPVRAPAWNFWMAGRQAWAERRWRDSVALLERAAQAWKSVEKSAAPSTLELLGPSLEPGRADFEIGVSYYRLEDYRRAAAALDASLAVAPKNAYALFLRARSKDALGDSEAIADYQTAADLARTSGDKSWAAGQAYYYRGLLLYRARRFRDAEAAFTEAAVAELGEISRQDASGWRYLAGVAAGDCTRVPELLEAAARLTPPQFPAGEAESLAFDCQMKEARTLEQLLALEGRTERKVPPEKSRELRGRIAEAYAADGVSAEDRRDLSAAVDAYRKALDWDPASSKARFNLGAIYLEHKNYPQAEEQYRALVGAYPTDYEAQYWLAEAILAQPLTPARRTEACGLMKRSLAIGDEAKRTQFSKALEAVKCR